MLAEGQITSAPYRCMAIDIGVRFNNNMILKRYRTLNDGIRLNGDMVADYGAVFDNR